MSFSPDISKQSQKVIFSRSLKKAPHPPLMFISNQVNNTSSQKNVDIILDESFAIGVVLVLLTLNIFHTLF